MIESQRAHWLRRAHPDKSGFGSPAACREDLQLEFNLNIKTGAGDPSLALRDGTIVLWYRGK
jgi:hypothetical protein